MTRIISEVDLRELQAALREKARRTRQDSKDQNASNEFGAALRGRAGGFSQAADWIESMIVGNYSYKEFVKLAVPTKAGYYLPEKPIAANRPNYPLILDKDGQWWSIGLKGSLMLSRSEVAQFGPFTRLKEDNS